MFIIWGTKVVKKYLGRRADYCPLCRQIRPMVRRKVESVGHLYYLPLGTRKPLTFVETCEECGLRHEMESNDEALLVASRRASMNDLVADTYPEIEAVYADSLSLASRLRQGSARGPERVAAVRNVLELADLVLGDRMNRLHMDVLSSICLIATIAAPILILAFGNSPGDPERLELIALCFAVVLGVATLLLIASDGRRYARQRLLRVLVRALAPLDPPIDELADILEQLRSAGANLPRYLSATRLRNAIDQAGPDPV